MSIFILSIDNRQVKSGRTLFLNRGMRPGSFNAEKQADAGTFATGSINQCSRPLTRRLIEALCAQ